MSACLHCNKLITKRPFLRHHHALQRNGGSESNAPKEKNSARTIPIKR